MCTRFDNNREKLVQLVYEMREFSEIEIKENFIKSTDQMIVDEHASIKDILNGLREIGSLRYDGSHYKVVSGKEKRSFNPFDFHVLA